MGWEAEGEAGGGDGGRLLGLGGEGGQQAEEAETGASRGRDAQGTVRARAQAGVCELWGVGSWCVSQAPGEDVRTACSTVSVPAGGGEPGLRMEPQGGRRQGRRLEHSRIFRRCGNSWSTSSGKRICTHLGNSFFFFFCRVGVWLREVSGMSSEIIKSSTGKWGDGPESPSCGARPTKR